MLNSDSYTPRQPDLIAPGDGQSLLQLIGPSEALQRGGVWVDNVRILDPDFVPDVGAEIYVRVPPSGSYASLDLSLEQIIYEDAWLIAINKPAGSYVEATPWDTFTHVRGELIRLLVLRDGIHYQLHLAHRLDRDTSGVLLLSKQAEANKSLQHAFMKHLTEKRYLAMCAGNPNFEELVIETGHGRSRAGRFRIYPIEEVGRLLPNGERVKSMCTRLQVTRHLPEAAMVWAWPETGRSHQIRLHLAQLGHAILGDATYGGPLEWQSQQLRQHRLHAEQLSLPHPITGEKLVISAALPEWARNIVKNC